MDRSGNWLFRWRSYMPLVLYVMAFTLILLRMDQDADYEDLTWILICVAVSLLGLVIRALTIGFTPAGTSGRNTKEGQVAEQLNTKGIYSMCRHPLYLGNFFMWLGIIMYVGNYWFTVTCVLLFWLYYERIMFAEEYFLRKKFGQKYLHWSEKTPAFFPRFSSFQPSGVSFSMRNVLKREYNGFFAVFLSFSLLNGLKNYLFYGSYRLEDLLDPFWQWALLFSFVVFIVLRTMKKQTRLLDVKGREFVE